MYLGSYWHPNRHPPFYVPETNLVVDKHPPRVSIVQRGLYFVTLYIAPSPDRVAFKYVIMVILCFKLLRDLKLYYIYKSICSNSLQHTTGALTFTAQPLSLCFLFVQGSSADEEYDKQNDCPGPSMHCSQPLQIPVGTQCAAYYNPLMLSVILLSRCVAFIRRTALSLS